MTFDYFAPAAQERQMPALDDAANFWAELEQLEAKPSAEDFDFGDDLEESDFVGQEIAEADSRALAVEFLECMGLHHGHARQDTLAAMEAIQ